MKYQHHGNYSDFWAMVKGLQQREHPEWVFTHCLPWEYANLCATLFKANEEITGFPATNLPSEVKKSLAREVLAVSDPSGSPWYPVACYPINARSVLPHMSPAPQITLENWLTLTTSYDDIRQSSKTQLLPRKLEAHTVLVDWVLAKVMGDYKTLDSSDGVISSVLYHHAHFVYIFSYGEAPMVELMTIFSMSLYLFYSSFLSETQQLMHQLNMSCIMRCYEAAHFHGGLNAESLSLRTAILQNTTSNKLAAQVKHMLSFFFTDVLCDVFLSLRMICIAMLTMASVMLGSLNHGVINVIFSVLAVAFILDIDDQFMVVIQSIGFVESSPYQERLKPAFLTNIRSEEENLVLNADNTFSRFASMKLSLRDFFIYGKVQTWGANVEDSQVACKGQRIVNFWSFLLTTALFVVHQYLSLSIAVYTGPSEMQETFKAVFDEFPGPGDAPFGLGIGLGIGWVGFIAWGITFSVCCLNTLCYAGLIALPALIQMGLCLVWVYGIIRNLTYLGILAWYSDCGPFDTYWDLFVRNVNADYLLIFPALGLHFLLCILRPLVLLISCRNSPGKGEGRMEGGESTEGRG